MTHAEILAWRTDLKLSQRAAASLLGVAVSTFQAWERGTWLRSNKPCVINRRTVLSLQAISNSINKGK